MVYTVSPVLLAWIAPVVLGLVLAIPISVVTGWPELGKAVGRLGLLATPEEIEPPTQITDALARLASDTRLRALHAKMLPATYEQRKGEYDIDLLLGLAKLDDAASLEEAAALLSNREKLAILGNRMGFERLCQLVRACPEHEQ